MLSVEILIAEDSAPVDMEPSNEGQSAKKGGAPSDAEYEHLIDLRTSMRARFDNPGKESLREIWARLARLLMAAVRCNRRV